MHSTIRSEKPSCRSVSAHTRPAAPERRARRGTGVRSPLPNPPCPRGPTTNLRPRSARWCCRCSRRLARCTWPSPWSFAAAARPGGGRQAGGSWERGSPPSPLCPPSGPGSPAPVVPLPHPGSPWPACQAPSHPRDPEALPSPFSLPESPSPTASPACWPGCTPSLSRSSPARAVELRPGLWGAPAPAPPGAHPTARQAPPGTCADCPGPGSPPGPRC